MQHCTIIPKRLIIFIHILTLHKNSPSELILLLSYQSYRWVVQNYHLFQIEHIHLLLWKLQRITQAELKLILCHSFPICQILRMKDDWHGVWLVNPSIKHSKMWKGRCCNEQHFYVLYFACKQTLKSVVVYTQHSYVVFLRNFKKYFCLFYWIFFI